MAFWSGQTRKKAVDRPPHAGVGQLLSDASRSGPSSSASNEILPGGERGRKHYAPGRSAHQEWKPSRKKADLPARPLSRSGKRSLEIPIPWVAGPGQKVHSSKFNALSSGESEFAGGIKIERKNRSIDERTGMPRAYVPSDETSLSATMGRKRKIHVGHTRALRNGVGVSNPGDKCYGTAEKAPGFYKEGSAVPGAAWGSFKRLPEYERKQRERPPATVLGTTVHGVGDNAPPPRVPTSFTSLSFEQRRIAERIAAEVAEVANLNPKKGDLDSWEKATGMWTVEPGEKAAVPASDE